MMNRDQFALLKPAPAGEVWMFPSLQSGSRSTEDASVVALQSLTPPALVGIVLKGDPVMTVVYPPLSERLVQ